jgi:hypothetical protein
MQLVIALAAVLVQNEKLAEAAKKAADWESYSYTLTVSTEGGRQNGGGQPATYKGEFDKNVGLHVKGDRGEGVRVGDKAAVKGSDGNWTVQQPRDPGQGGGGGGGGQGGRRPGGGRPGGMGGGMVPTQPPHRDLAKIDSAFSSVKSESQGDNTVYSGPLTKEGAADLLGGMVKRLVDGGGSVEGTASVTVDKDGNIVKLAVEGKATGKMRDREISMTIKRTVEFGDFGKAKVEIPEEAKKALEAK